MNPYSNVCVGTDSMHSKSKKQSIIKNNSIVRKYRITRKIVKMQGVESAKEH